MTPEVEQEILTHRLEAAGCVLTDTGKCVEHLTAAWNLITQELNQ